MKYDNNIVGYWFKISDMRAQARGLRQWGEMGGSGTGGAFGYGSVSVDIQVYLMVIQQWLRNKDK